MPDNCNQAKIDMLRRLLLHLLSELKKVETADESQKITIANNMLRIDSNIQFYCLQELADENSDNGAFAIQASLRPSAALLKMGNTTGAKECITYVRQLLNYLKQKHPTTSDSGPKTSKKPSPKKPSPSSKKSSPSSKKSSPSSKKSSPSPKKSKPSPKKSRPYTRKSKTNLFPTNKYLNLTEINESNLKKVNSEYKKLMLLYHPDKCPNKKHNFNQKECTEITKVINNEYDNIQKLFKGGEKRHNKTYKLGKN